MEAPVPPPTNPHEALCAFFTQLENALRLALLHLMRLVGGVPSPDVRMMLGFLSYKWDTRTGLFLQGAPLVSTKFLYVKNILNSYHHSDKIHWRVLAEGVSSALDILQVLHEYAVADTLTSNEELAAQWAAILAQRPPGDFAFDQTQQVLVEDWPWATTITLPKVQLVGVPPGTTAQNISDALKLQDFHVPCERVSLDVVYSNATVELDSQSEREELLGIGYLSIKLVKIPVAMLEDRTVVALYLPKEIDLESVRQAWCNEHCNLDSGRLSYDGNNHRAILIVLEPAQLAELQHRTLTLLRRKIHIVPYSSYRLRLRPTVNSPIEDSTVTTTISGVVGSGEIVGFTTSECCFIVHLRSAEAHTKLIQKKQLALTDNIVHPPLSSKQKNSMKRGSAATTAKNVNELPTPSNKAAGEKESKTMKATLLLHPIQNYANVSDLITEFKQHTQVDIEFITIRDNCAFAEIKQTHVEKALTASSGLIINNSPVMVELFDGEVPLSVVGLKPSFPHLPKGRVTQEILKAFNKLNGGRLGSIQISQEDIQVPVLNKACLERILELRTMDVLGQQLQIFRKHSHCTKIEELKDMLSMQFLKKQTKELQRLRETYEVTIEVEVQSPSSATHEGTVTPVSRTSGRGRAGGSSRPDKNGVFKQPFVTTGAPGVGQGRGGTSDTTSAPMVSQGRGGITGSKSPLKPNYRKESQKPREQQSRPKLASASPVRATKRKTAVPCVFLQGSRAGVHAALEEIQAILSKATIKKSTFRFSPADSQLCILLEGKIKELERCEPEVAFIVKQNRSLDGSSALEVSMMGSNFDYVSDLALKPNSFRTKLVIQRLAQFDPTLSKALNELQKAYQVLISYDEPMSELAIAGTREAVQMCMENLQKNDAKQPVILTSGDAQLFKEFLQSRFPKIRFKSVKKKSDAIVLTGPSEDLDAVQAIAAKSEISVLPHCVSPNLADFFESYVRQQIEEWGISAVVRSRPKKEEMEEEEEEEMNYYSISEDEGWTLIEVWSLDELPEKFAQHLCNISLELRKMPYFSSEVEAVNLLDPTIVSTKFTTWVQIIKERREIVCAAFNSNAVDDALLFISDILKRGNLSEPRVIYSFSPTTIDSIQNVISELGLEHLTFNCQNQDWVAVKQSDLMDAMIENMDLVVLTKR